MYEIPSRTDVKKVIINGDVTDHTHDGTPQQRPICATSRNCGSRELALPEDALKWFWLRPRASGPCSRRLMRLRQSITFRGQITASAEASYPLRAGEADGSFPSRTVEPRSAPDDNCGLSAGAAQRHCFSPRHLTARERSMRKSLALNESIPGGTLVDVSRRRALIASGMQEKIRSMARVRVKIGWAEPNHS